MNRKEFERVSPESVGISSASITASNRIQKLMQQLQSVLLILKDFLNLMSD